LYFQAYWAVLNDGLYYLPLYPQKVQFLIIRIIRNAFRVLFGNLGC